MPTTRKIRILIVLTMFALSCEHNDVRLNTCNTSNPAEDLPWLKSKIEELEASTSDTIKKYFYVAQGKYKNETVFIFGDCCPMCNTIMPVYNCEGTVLFNLDEAYRSKISSFSILWQSEIFECAF